MDAKLKEDLFRRYVTALERRLEEEYAWIGTAPDGDKGRHKDSEALLSTATALLGAYQPDPGQRFRMVRFYEVVENSLRCQRGGNIKSLERAFHTLETICTNLLLFPWKKEFRCIKVNESTLGCHIVILETVKYLVIKMLVKSHVFTIYLTFLSLSINSFKMTR